MHSMDGLKKKKKRLAPLKKTVKEVEFERKEDEEPEHGLETTDVAANLLEEVFGEMDEVGNRAKTKFEKSEGTNLNKSATVVKGNFVDLDDWDIPISASEFSSDNVNQKPVKTPKDPKPTPKDKKVPGLVSSFKSILGESNSSVAERKQMLFSSREYEEDSTIRLRFLKRDVPASQLKDLKATSELVPLSTISKWPQSKNWFTFGVVTEYGELKTAAGARIDVTDLAAEPCSVRILLFGAAFREYGKKFPVGTIVCILNPTQGKPHNGKGALIVNNESQFIIAGSSRDFGLCGASKKSGGLCRAVVNMNICRYCRYHAVQEYKKQKMSKDIRAAAAGVGFGVKTTATDVWNAPADRARFLTPATKSVAIMKKDRDRLARLSSTPKSGKTNAENVAKPLVKIDAAQVLQKRKSEMMEGSSSNLNNAPKKFANGIDKVPKPEGMISSHIASNPTFTSPNTSMPTFTSPNASKPTFISPDASKPTLTSPNSSKPAFTSPNPSKLKFTSPIATMPALPSPNQGMSSAKRKALEFARNNGGVIPQTPKPKPKIEVDKAESGGEKEKFKGITAEFLAMMASGSSNPSLLAEAEAEERDKRFDRLRVIEEIGEKLVATHEVPVRAIRCLECAKTYHQLPLQCVMSKHKCRVVMGTKRFFQCTGCKGRTTSLERFPSAECGTCRTWSWKRAGMAAERVCSAAAPLSVRGLEETFIGTASSDGNLSLLVPEDKVAP